MSLWTRFSLRNFKTASSRIWSLLLIPESTFSQPWKWMRFRSQTEAWIFSLVILYGKQIWERKLLNFQQFKTWTVNWIDNSPNLNKYSRNSFSWRWSFLTPVHSEPKVRYFVEKQIHKFFCNFVLIFSMDNKNRKHFCFFVIWFWLWFRSCFTGRKPTHDFLSLYSTQPTVQQDPRPSSQGKNLLSFQFIFKIPKNWLFSSVYLLFFKIYLFLNTYFFICFYE